MSIEIYVYIYIYMDVNVSIYIHIFMVCVGHRVQTSFGGDGVCNFKCSP